MGFIGGFLFVVLCGWLSFGLPQKSNMQAIPRCAVCTGVLLTEKFLRISGNYDMLVYENNIQRRRRLCPVNN